MANEEEKRSIDPFEGGGDEEGGRPPSVSSDRGGDYDAPPTYRPEQSGDEESQRPASSDAVSNDDGGADVNYSSAYGDIAPYQRKIRALTALSGILCVAVLALAIFAAVGAAQGRRYANKYANHDWSKGPPEGLEIDMSQFGGGGAGGQGEMPDWVKEMLSEQGEGAQAAESAEDSSSGGQQGPPPGAIPPGIDLSDYEGQAMPDWVAEMLSEQGAEQKPTPGDDPSGLASGQGEDFQAASAEAASTGGQQGPPPGVIPPGIDLSEYQGQGMPDWVAEMLSEQGAEQNPTSGENPSGLASGQGEDFQAASAEAPSTGGQQGPPPGVIPPGTDLSEYQGQGMPDWVAEMLSEQGGPEQNPTTGENPSGPASGQGEEFQAASAEAPSTGGQQGPPPGVIPPGTDLSEYQGQGMPDWVAEMLTEQDPLEQSLPGSVPEGSAQGDASKPCTPKPSSGPPAWVDVSEYEGTEPPAWVQAMFIDNQDEEPCEIEGSETASTNPDSSPNEEVEDLAEQGSDVQEDEGSSFEGVQGRFEVWQEVIEMGCDTNYLCCLFMYRCSNSG